MNSRSKLKRKRQIRRRVGLVMVCGVLVVYNIISYNNSLIKLMAEEEKVFYLEVNECVADTGGYLPSAAANDGIHLNKEYCMKWYNYLCEHVNG